jgi:hypothetical protein
MTIKVVRRSPSGEVAILTVLGESMRPNFPNCKIAVMLILEVLHNEHKE